MSNRKQNRNIRFVETVEQVMLGNEITLQQYNFLNSYIESITANRGFKGKLDINDLTNELLLRLRIKADTYRFNDNINGRRRYILYYILYCINDIIALTWYGVDIPQRMLQDITIDNTKLCISLDETDEIIDKEDYQTELNIDMENSFLFNLLLSDISDKEKDIIVKHYFKGMTQQEIAEGYGVSQQMIGSIISNIKTRFQYNCNADLDNY